MADHWVLDGWVLCPACGEYGDAAAVFGDATPERWALTTGLTGKCDCGETIRVELTVAPQVSVQSDPGVQTGGARE